MLHATARLHACLAALLLSLHAFAPRTFAAGVNWQNPGSSSATVEWNSTSTGISIVTREVVGAFQFNEAFDGGVFTVNASDGEASLTFGGAGIINLSSARPTFRTINNGYIFFGTGSLGDAIYNIDDGSLRIRTSNSIDGSLATINLSGGMLLANNPADGGTMRVGAVNGGSAIDYGSAEFVVGNATDAAYSGAITGTGSFTKVGTGTWTLSGGSTYEGDTFISAGTIKIANVTGSVFGTGDVTVDAAGTLTGAGSFTGGLTNLGTYAPGNSPALVTLSSFTQGSTGTLALEIAGLARGTGYDALDITGAAAFDGTLEVTFIDGFSAVSLNAGDSFNFFDWGSVSGTFDTLDLPTLGAGLAWDASALYTTGVLSVGTSAIPEPSTYAVLFGFAVLIAAVIRKRRLAAPACQP